MRNKIIFLSVILVASLIKAEDLDTMINQCKENNASSCYEAGSRLITGKNGEDQEKKSLGLEYIRKACKYSVQKACDILGENYYLDKHYQAARPYLIVSCNNGIQSACEGVGTMYRDAQDVKQDDVKAREFYDKACDLGSGDACINIAIMYRGGFGVKIDRVQEKAYYKKSCEHGSEVGCSSFTRMDNEDKGIEEPGIWEKFKSLFK